jgi:outer membrane protein assembly factor BamB
LIVALFLSVSSADAEDWPRFRGPDGSGVSDAKGLPVSWSDTENVAWKTALPGFGAGSAIVIGDRIFVTCYSGYGQGEDRGEREDLKLHVVCVDKKSGKILWDKAAASDARVKSYGGFIELHGYASATPACDGKAVYASFGSNGVYAYDIDGKFLWRKRVGKKTHGFGTANSPVLYGDVVIINASVESGSLYALSKKDGSEVWKAGGIRESWNTPLVVTASSGRKEIVINTKGAIRSFDPKTGKELWSCDAVRDYICPSVIAHDGVVFAIGGRAATCIAVKAGGSGKVERFWKASVGSNVSSPSYLDGKLYWVSDRGVAVSIDARTGENPTKHRIRGTGKVYASVLIADGRIYAVSRNNGTFVLAADDSFEQLAHNKLGSDGSVFNASPAVSDGKLYLRSNKFLYCLSDSKAAKK